MSSPFDDGFEIKGDKANCKSEGPISASSSECKFVAFDSAGQPLYAPASGAKDLEKVGTYTVYRFPKNMNSQDFDALGSQMREFSKFVGTSLHAEPKGPGETAWLTYARSQQFQAHSSAARKGTKAFCQAIVKSFIDSLLPEGSEFRQYGNCGEGGRVGACLALKANFDSKDQIRVCASRNDHFFAMVKHTDTSKQWCILDRWPLINNDNFACNVDWDEKNQVITYEGKPTQEKWFKRVTCAPFQEFIDNGADVTLLPDIPGASTSRQ